MRQRIARVTLGTLKSVCSSVGKSGGPGVTNDAASSPVRLKEFLFALFDFCINNVKSVMLEIRPFGPGKLLLALQRSHIIHYREKKIEIWPLLLLYCF